eukprot:s3253_g9.t1
MAEKEKKDKKEKKEKDPKDKKEKKEEKDDKKDKKEKKEKRRDEGGLDLWASTVDNTGTFAGANYGGPKAPQDKREKEIAKEKEIKKVSPCFAYTDSQRSSKSYIVLLL